MRTIILYLCFFLTAFCKPPYSDLETNNSFRDDIEAINQHNLHVSYIDSINCLKAPKSMDNRFNIIEFYCQNSKNKELLPIKSSINIYNSDSLLKRFDKTKSKVFYMIKSYQDTITYLGKLHTIEVTDFYSDEEYFFKRPLFQEVLILDYSNFLSNNTPILRALYYFGKAETSLYDFKAIEHKCW